MDIQVYINEASLQGQLCGLVSETITTLIATINALRSNNRVNIKVYTSSRIFQKQICASTGVTFAQLSKIDRDLFESFKGLLDKGEYWDKNPLQSETSSYQYKQQTVVGTSIAEARECIERGLETMVVSFPGTQYVGHTLEVEKNGVIKKAVDHRYSC